MTGRPRWRTATRARPNALVLSETAPTAARIGSRQLAIVKQQIDAMTGARARGSGLTELAREVARADRTSQPLTLAYVDVDHLKVVNDSYGHAAGDTALVAVADAIRQVLRSYDLLVRVGGDEFLCVLAGVTEAAARDRLAGVNESLAATGQPSATFGFAELLPGETPDALIQRADADLNVRRQERSGHGRT